MYPIGYEASATVAKPIDAENPVNYDEDAFVQPGPLQSAQVALEFRYLTVFSRKFTFAKPGN